MRRHVLVTGGAGYIGSHIVRQLGEAGYGAVVLDTLETGFRDAVLCGEFVMGDVADSVLVRDVLRHFRIGAVLHLAAHTAVPESVADPLRYYRNNTSASCALIESSVAEGVEHFVFSSTAAVYGEPDADLIGEETPANPINPYGASKLMTERMLRDVSAATGMRHTILRYFNVAGADPKGRIGQSTKKATLLVKVACEAALGKRDGMPIYGTDFPTPDGTAVRDYIHVEDLADAHLCALRSLEDGAESGMFNCGYGRGYSVREVIAAVERAAGVSIDTREAPRRAGDPPRLVADATRIRNHLGWTPGYDDLDTIVKTALAWERTLRRRP
ncbi:MAG: UDP-glucose 4-epimerase GalE [Rhodospirillaceae bacterium]|nr:UDP-glucose 4-epimerase GalE [Rhodospirillaceae bacterium]MCY4066351.1 UDP-glucose 4-epimerase GalE [Rhodospirillaceae bacterium]